MDEMANTVNYFIAGYTVIFSILAFYLGSLIIRWKNLTQDEKILSELDEKQD